MTTVCGSSPIDVDVPAAPVEAPARLLLRLPRSRLLPRPLRLR